MVAMDSVYNSSYIVSYRMLVVVQETEGKGASGT